MLPALLGDWISCEAFACLAFFLDFPGPELPVQNKRPRISQIPTVAATGRHKAASDGVSKHRMYCIYLHMFVIPYLYPQPFTHAILSFLQKALQNFIRHVNSWGKDRESPAWGRQGHPINEVSSPPFAPDLE